MTAVDERLLLAAAELVEQIGVQAERDRANFEAGFRVAARMFFEHGHQVGYERAHREIEERQTEVNHELAERTKDMDAAARERAKLVRLVPCGEPGCRTLEHAYFRSDPRVVRCLIHRPPRYYALLKASRRPLDRSFAERETA